MENKLKNKPKRRRQLVIQSGEVWCALFAKAPVRGEKPTTENHRGIHREKTHKPGNKSIAKCNYKRQN